MLFNEAITIMGKKTQEKKICCFVMSAPDYDHHKCPSNGLPYISLAWVCS